MGERADWVRPWTAILGLSVLVACGEVSSERSDHGWETLDVPTFRPAPEPQVVIGDRGDSPEYRLHLPTGALRLSDGRIVVANSQSRQLRFYGADGEHHYSVGREGEGPGEFGGPVGLHRDVGDTVMAWDRRQRRVTRVAPDGSVVEVMTVPIDTEDLNMAPDAFMSIQDVHPMNSGALVASVRASPALGRPGQTDLVHETRPVAIYQPEPDEITLLGPFPSQVWFRYDRVVESLPFTPRLVVAAGREVAYVGTQESDTILRFTDRGEPMAPFMVPLSKRPVTPEDAQFVLGGSIERTVPELRERRQEVHDAMTLPDSMPAYDRIRVDAVDRLWVRRAEGADRARRRWVILGPDGAPEARVLIPEELELFDAGPDHVLVHATGEFDIDLIQLHRLEPAGAEADERTD